MEGHREVTRNIDFYNLDVILSVGYRVKSQQGTQFRIWATQRLKEYIVKGFALNDERFKTGSSYNYFKDLLDRIREIRLSERLFYQQIKDIYATSIDYDPKSQVTKQFFARVQNKLHWAIHGQTAAEVVYNRADSEAKYMGLKTWKDAPYGKIQKFDVSVAKNYLNEEELRSMARIVNAYLDLAEVRANKHIPMTMEDWAKQFDGVLQLTQYEILAHSGSISAEVAKRHAESEFEKYRIKQDRLFTSDFDHFILESEEQEPEG